MLPFLVSLASAFPAFPLLAQPIAATDGTDTVVRAQGNRFEIQGGTLSGDNKNLFHSFERFSLGSGERANFLATPDIQNILGRVVGGEASRIDGLLQVTGGNANLFLMNPAGIVLGANAALDVPASFTATTANGIQFGNAWFSASGTNHYAALVGNPTAYAFTTSQPGSVVNAGNLTVREGENLTLLGGTVINTGTLQAPTGQITLAAVPGESWVQIARAGMLLSLEIRAEAGNLPEALPFAPQALPELLTGGAVANATQVRTDPDGTVRLSGSGVEIPTDSGTVVASGSLDVAGRIGGEVNILGDRVGLVNARVDASGSFGGGTVRIGGDYRGQGTVPNASHTLVSQDTTIRLDAGSEGNGGRAIAWANNLTEFYGNISARGGANTGNGGFVEVSGQRDLVFRGTVDLSASQGRLGTLLLDPTNIVIVRGSGAADDAQLADGQIFQGDGSATYTLSETALEGLSGGANVILEATNNIEVEDLGDNFLTFAPGTGAIAFRADADNNGMGDFLMASGDTIRAEGRDVDISGASLVVGSINTSSDEDGGAIALSATGDIITGDLLSFAVGSGEGGDISLTSSGGTIDTRAGVLDSGSDLGEAGDITLTAAGTIALGALSAFSPGTGGTIAINSGAATTPLPSAPEPPTIAEDFYPTVPILPTPNAGLSENATVFPGDAQAILRRIERETGVKPALIYATFVPKTALPPRTEVWQFNQEPVLIPPDRQVRNDDWLELVLVTPDGKPRRWRVEGTNREHILATAKDLRRRATAPISNAYLAPAQQLYQWLVAPMETALQARGIDNLVFIMDAGLRSMPIAALHDGTEFIVERYSVGLMPQLALTDTRYVNLENVEVLAMGASQFEEQVPLPSVPVELKSIAQQLWQGTLFLNEEFTLENLKRARASHPYGIIHLATHAEFAPGSAGDSYIQFWQSQLHLEQLRQLGWHKPPVELLVLSACRTALGDAETELGFAGFAVHAGVKSVLASLWYVSDEGTLALMREFYQQLSLPEVTTKAEALRRAQVAMIEGQLGVGAEQGRGIGWQDNTLAAQSDRDLSHPYYWSAFTLVGNPW